MRADASAVCVYAWASVTSPHAVQYLVNDDSAVIIVAAEIHDLRAIVDPYPNGRRVETYFDAVARQRFGQ